MSKPNNFEASIQSGYNSASKNINITIGAAMLDGKVYPNSPVTIPLATLNRHGLIAGATGTGKTKTIQMLAEQLSEQGVPSLVMDIKGDLSGLAATGTTNDKITARMQQLNLAFKPTAYPIEFLSLSQQPGAKLRATITEFGPLLLSQILDLNETQASVMTVIFKYCQDQNLALIDIKDLTKVLQYLNTDAGKASFTAEYGSISSQSLSTILRKTIALSQQDADSFFSEPSFEVNDLCRIDSDSQQGIISVLRLIDLQQKPQLFATFMLGMLTEIYQHYPELGDIAKPKLVIFIDEAHLLFKQASNALLDKIEMIVKLIRSKGVSVIFCTQRPDDIPNAVLSQLGMKIQHALRAFTAKDRKAIKLIAENYPLSDFYDTAELITSLGVGEAMVTALDEKGRPTPLAACMLRAPQSRMGVLSEDELNQLTSKSMLTAKYATVLDRESAYEKLQQRLQQRVDDINEIEAGKPETQQKAQRKPTSKQEDNILETLSKNTMVRQMGRTFMRELTRNLSKILGLKK